MWTMLSQFVLFLFAVEYGIERMNREVSMWMKCPTEDSDNETDIPFIATRGYDSVVWSRLYSQDDAERTRRALLVRKIIQSSNHNLRCFLLHHRKYFSQWEQKIYTSWEITQTSMLVSVIFHCCGANTEICGSKGDGGRAYSPDPWGELVYIVLKSQLEIFYTKDSQ